MKDALEELEGEKRDVEVIGKIFKKTKNQIPQKYMELCIIKDPFLFYVHFILNMLRWL